MFISSVMTRWDCWNRFTHRRLITPAELLFFSCQTWSENCAAVILSGVRGENFQGSRSFLKLSCDVCRLWPRWSCFRYFCSTMLSDKPKCRTERLLASFQGNLFAATPISALICHICRVIHRQSSSSEAWSHRETGVNYPGQSALLCFDKELNLKAFILLI